MIFCGDDDLVVISSRDGLTSRCYKSSANIKVASTGDFETFVPIRFVIDEK